jgi:hypothetical protein
MFLVTHDDHNTMVMWNQTDGRSLRLDFSMELNSVGKSKAILVR